MVESYIKKQGTVSAVVTAVLNVLVLWLGNREMRPVGVSAVVVDVFVTSVLVALLCALFAAHGVRRDADRLGEAPAGRSRAERLLVARLPVAGWRLGLLVGAVVGLVLAAVLLLLGVAGLSAMSFAAFAFAKAVFTGALAFATTRWVVLRDLSVGTDPSGPSALPAGRGARDAR